MKRLEQVNTEIYKTLSEQDKKSYIYTNIKTKKENLLKEKVQWFGYINSIYFIDKIYNETPSILDDFLTYLKKEKQSINIKNLPIYKIIINKDPIWSLYLLTRKLLIVQFTLLRKNVFIQRIKNLYLSPRA